jgi:soluble lytic murein transglycosylase-like protein
MPRSKHVSKLVLNFVELTICFMHGALVMSGALVVALAAGYLSGGLDRYLPVKEAVAEEADVAPDQSVEASLATLASERTAVISYLVRRYRVSSLAIEPVVSAAHSAGARLGLDPLLIIAVMAVESRFNPFA